ncbi:uncharacterized protein UHOD_11222 [Ustilago sp. UG-2017b]|nr:uncharacterized protein UHOD_11222 [Ustilago sp. UG-2017b]
MVSSTTDLGGIRDINFARADLDEICSRAVSTTDLSELCCKSYDLPDSLIPALPSYELTDLPASCASSPMTEGLCHGSECTGSKKALGSYGRSIGVRDQADPQRSRPWPMDEEMLEKAWSECNLHGECSLHGDHGHGGPGRMHGDPSTATRRTELKEHTDGSHSGARETRVKGTVTGQRRRSSV